MEPWLLMGTEVPLGRVTKELGTDCLEEKREEKQETWCVAPVSSIQKEEEKLEVEREERREKIPLKLQAEMEGGESLLVEGVA